LALLKARVASHTAPMAKSVVSPSPIATSTTTIPWSIEIVG
jgi:hypothetical protein